MIKVKIQGGLGNQLFQFCAGMNLAIQEEREIKFYWGHSGRDSMRRYSLDFLGIKPRTSYLPVIKDDEIFLKPRRRIAKLSSKTISRYNLVQEEKFNFEPIESDFKKINLVGFYQSEKFFLENKSLLKSYIDSCLKKFVVNFGTEENTFSPNFALHLRFGDYLQFPYNDVHANLTPEYYLKGIGEFESWRHADVIRVFSDDLALAQNFLSDSKFKGFRFQFRKSQNEYVDLCSMVDIPNLVIANSTFSWWGGYLGSPKKRIIAPDNWFTPKFLEIHDTKDLFPASWKRI